jgi:hypothetical protein
MRHQPSAISHRPSALAISNLSPQGGICVSRGREPAVQLGKKLSRGAATQPAALGVVPEGTRVLLIPTDRGLTPAANTNAAAPQLTASG